MISVWRVVRQVMKTKLVSRSRGQFEEELNTALEELNDKEIIDIKFTQSTNDRVIILSALIIYK